MMNIMKKRIIQLEAFSYEMEQKYHRLKKTSEFNLSATLTIKVIIITTTADSIQ